MNKGNLNRERIALFAVIMTLPVTMMCLAFLITFTDAPILKDFDTCFVKNTQDVEIIENPEPARQLSFAPSYWQTGLYIEGANSEEGKISNAYCQGDGGNWKPESRRAPGIYEFSPEMQKAAFGMIPCENPEIFEQFEDVGTALNSNQIIISLAWTCP